MKHVPTHGCSASEPRITVFTPTFNRGRLLGRIHRCLQEQTAQGFEWLIVDDGSVDNTEDVVGQWMADANFPLRYVRQENSGKHVAINRGVSLAEGALFMVLDSDDRLLPAALERVWHWWTSIPEKERPTFAGVAGHYAYPLGKLVGTRFPTDVLDANAVELRTRYRVRGDKLQVYRTELLRQYPFPEDLGRFVTEGLVWNRIARTYKLRCVNEVWGEVGYQPDGLSSKSMLLRVQSPRAARLYYKEFTEMTGLGISPRLLGRQYANLIRFSLHARIPFTKQLREARSRGLWAMALPVGLWAFLRDRVCLARATKKGT